MSAIESLVRELLHACAQRGIMLATAESCTGGMIAAQLTDIAGSSTVFDRGFVTYSNEAKIDMLGVSADTLARHGAVSCETAREMATGALSRSRAGIAVSVTGIAGPGGGTEQKPVGTVWFGLAVRGAGAIATKRQFDDLGREYIRRQSVRAALEQALEALKAEDAPGD